MADCPKIKSQLRVTKKKGTNAKLSWRELICHQFLQFLGVSALIGAMSGVIGMILSGALNLPSGPSIVLVQLLVFLVVVFSSQGKF